MSGRRRSERAAFDKRTAEKRKSQSMHIVPITVPTPFYVGDVNVYLVREDPLTLIDVGPKTPEAVEALRSGLAAQGVSFADIRRIVLTHAHEDHCGLAKTVRDAAKNAEIYVHDWETGHLFGRLAQEQQRGFLLKAGVPEGVVAEMHSLYEEVSLLTDALEESDLKSLADDMELEFESGSLRVLHTPGHTPGSCSFIREANRTLYCGDCVLKRITPNPMLAPDPIDPERRFASIAEFLVSLAKLRATAPTMIHGGHGEPVTDFEEIFNRYVRAIDERQRKVISLVPNDGINAFELAAKLFADSFDHGVHRFLAVSEAIAHLDHAYAAGKLGLESKGVIETYRK